MAIYLDNPTLLGQTTLPRKQCNSKLISTNDTSIHIYRDRRWKKKLSFQVTERYKWTTLLKIASVVKDKHSGRYEMQGW